VRTFQLTDNKKENFTITWQANKISILHIILVVINFGFVQNLVGGVVFLGLTVGKETKPAVQN
jgi:ABC-type Fe3+-siderophore transport system permease subunit